MKALITGGAGFIGSHIADRLLADGHQVIVLDDFSTGKRENLSDHRNLEVIECDIRDADIVDKHMAGVDWVFHKAAVASVPKTVNDPIGSSQVNYLASLNVLEAARRHKIKRLVFASSAALYGDEPTLPKVETMAPVTLSPYAVDKLATECACGVYSRLYGVDTVCLRYFNVYGPRQDPSSPYSGVISIFADKLSSGQTPMIFGDGEQTRDFVFVSDVVEANMRAVQIESGDGAIFNVATSNKQTLNTLLKIMCELQQCEFSAEYAEPRQGDIKHSYATIDKAIENLNWRPDVSLEEGLSRLLQSPSHSQCVQISSK